MKGTRTNQAAEYDRLSCEQRAAYDDARTAGGTHAEAMSAAKQTPEAEPYTGPRWFER